MIRITAATIVKGAVLVLLGAVLDHPSAAAMGAERGPAYSVPVAAGSADLPVERRILPALSVTDAEGQLLPLDHWQGRVVVLNFWASWCPPCIAEMPGLDRLQGRLAGLPVEVLAINEDRGGMSVAKSFFAGRKYAFLKPFADPGMHAQQRLAVQGLPTTLIIDKQGRQVERLEGSREWDSQAMVQRLTALAAE